MGFRENDDRDLEASSEAEEMLPLYSETDQPQAGSSSASGEVKLPAVEATPEEIREYFIQVLRKRGIDLERAKSLAAKWTLGSGKELRDYSQEMFTGIFGAEEGYVIHSDLQPLVQKEKKRREYDQELGRKWYYSEYRLDTLDA